MSQKSYGEKKQMEANKNLIKRKYAVNKEPYNDVIYTNEPTLTHQNHLYYIGLIIENYL